MDKRYQIFLSSTYSDLKEERQKVYQTLMEMDCIPAGMELFPATDEEQFEFIKKIIDDCDYYLLIIGGRYGSITSEGISYTEKEYDYAIEKKLKVIAFIHEDPSTLISAKTDRDQELEKKLFEFREKVKQNRLIKTWKIGNELPGLVALSLSKTIKTYPAIGWVRATSIGTAELLAEINALRKENEELRNKLAKENQNIVSIEDIASLDEHIEIQAKYRVDRGSYLANWNGKITWKTLFALIAPKILKKPNDYLAKSNLSSCIHNYLGKSFYDFNIEDNDFETIKIQFKALGLINIDHLRTTDNKMALFWSLTSKGEALMIELRVIRNNQKIPQLPQ